MSRSKNILNIVLKIADLQDAVESREDVAAADMGQTSTAPTAPISPANAARAGAQLSQHSHEPPAGCAALPGALTLRLVFGCIKRNLFFATITYNY